MTAHYHNPSVLVAHEVTQTSIFIRVNELHPYTTIMNQEFLERVRESILRDGMRHPIVVLSLTVGEWKKMQQVNKDMLDPPDLPDDANVKMIMCGHNRWTAAKQIGCTLIECYLVNSLEAASSLCKRTRSTEFLGGGVNGQCSLLK